MTSIASVLSRHSTKKRSSKILVANLLPLFLLVVVLSSLFSSQLLLSGVESTIEFTTIELPTLKSSLLPFSEKKQVTNSSLAFIVGSNKVWMGSLAALSSPKNQKEFLVIPRNKDNQIEVFIKENIAKIEVTKEEKNTSQIVVSFLKSERPERVLQISQAIIRGVMTFSKKQPQIILSQIEDGQL